jgi:(R,R)-butanediol dehydrogenase/meso-butanediol dehydrogenase/diacetyl reductase/L-iditol 2-dehydrogenase
MVSEPVASKRELAKKLGADLVVDPARDDVIMTSVTATSFRGFDLVIEASGSPQASKQVFEIAGQKAVIFYFAVYPTDFTVPMSPFTLYLKELTVKGVFFSPYAFPRAINMLPKLDLDALITHRFTLEESHKAFGAHETGEAVKIIIDC